MATTIRRRYEHFPEGSYTELYHKHDRIYRGVVIRHVPSQPAEHPRAASGGLLRDDLAERRRAAARVLEALDVPVPRIQKPRGRRPLHRHGTRRRTPRRRPLVGGVRGSAGAEVHAKLSVCLRLRNRSRYYRASRRGTTSVLRIVSHAHYWTSSVRR